MKKINYLFVIILVWLQYSLWLGKNGILDCITVYNCTKLYKTEYNLNSMKIRNHTLLLEICNLLYEDDIIEEYARYNLNMIKSGECFYQLKFHNSNIY